MRGNNHENAMSLLDMSARRVSCSCLSDLRTPALFPRIAKIVEETGADEYPQREWEDAVYYIAREKPEDGVAHGKEYLLNCLKAVK